MFLARDSADVLDVACAMELQQVARKYGMKRLELMCELQLIMFEEENEVYGSFETDRVGEKTTVDGERSRKSLDDYYEDAIEAIRTYRRDKLAEKKPFKKPFVDTKEGQETADDSFGIYDDDEIIALYPRSLEDQLLDPGCRTGSSLQVVENLTVDCEEDLINDAIAEHTRVNNSKNPVEKEPLPTATNDQTKKPSSDMRKSQRSTNDYFEDCLAAAEGYCGLQQYKAPYLIRSYHRNNSTGDYYEVATSEASREYNPKKPVEKKPLLDTACSSKAGAQARKPSVDMKKGQKSTVDDFGDDFERGEEYITNQLISKFNALDKYRIDCEKDKKCNDFFEETKREAIRKYTLEKLAEKNPLSDAACTSKAVLSGNIDAASQILTDYPFDKEIEAGKGRKQQLQQREFLNTCHRIGSNQWAGRPIRGMPFYDTELVLDLYEGDSREFNTKKLDGNKPEQVAACMSKVNDQVVLRPSIDTRMDPKQTSHHLDGRVEEAQLQNQQFQKRESLKSLNKIGPNHRVAHKPFVHSQKCQDLVCRSVVVDMPWRQPSTVDMACKPSSARKPLKLRVEKVCFKIPLIAVPRVSDKLGDAFGTDLRNEISLEAGASDFTVTGLQLQFKKEPTSGLNLICTFENLSKRSFYEEVLELDGARRTDVHFQSPQKVNPNEKAKIMIEIDDVKQRDCFLTVSDRKNWGSRDFKIGVNSNKMDSQHHHHVFCISAIFYKREFA